MAHSLFSAPSWLHYFDTIDSTNNYAMKLVETGLAKHGEVIWAKHQLAGKGQRGKTWVDNENNLKFSLMINGLEKKYSLFSLNMITAIALTNYLKTILPDNCQIFVKWPNDIYINDKKAVGILIENSFRGMNWNFSVIGIGINLHQQVFPEDLSLATSLYNESGLTFSPFEIIQDFRQGLLNAINKATPSETLLNQYNNYLYKKDKQVLFRDKKTNNIFEAFVMEVTEEGQIILLSPTGILKYQFGELEWLFKPRLDS